MPREAAGTVPAARFAFDAVDGEACVGRGVLLAIGAVVLAAVGFSALPAAEDSLSWRIAKIAKSDRAEPGGDAKPREDASLKYLHIQLAPRPAKGDLKLYQFRIVDREGNTVAEIYGFHKDRGLVVFEGDWSRLDGLYLDGAGHREPLFAERPQDRTERKSEEKRPATPAPSEPPGVMSRSRARPAARGKIEGVEAPVPARPERRESSVAAKSVRPDRRPAVWAPPKEGKLYQELIVTQRSRYRMEGTDFDSDLQYRVLSSLSVDRRDPDGSLSVTQTVEQAELTRGDALTQAIIRELLGKLVGSTLRIAVDAEGRVVALEGAKGRIRAAAGNDPLAGQSLLMASIIDPDGWKEIAQLTFFRPPAQSAGKKWDRAVTHRWGPLGSWSGRASYAQQDRDGALDRFSYALKLGYQPPKGGAGGLPFQVLRSDFRHQEAGGTIEFDAAKGRVVRARERFPVKGNLTIGLLGQEVPVELDESQDFLVRILEEKPD